MIKTLLAGAILTAVGVAATAMPQPPGGEGREGRPPGPPPNPFVDALDTNGDREISEEELKNATASLLKLDKNGDGKLTDDETRPPRPEGGAREGRDGGPPRDGDRPPREGNREGRDGQRPPRDGDRPPREGDRAGRDGQGPPRDGDRPPRPNPERFVDDAMRFDADGDGKLDRKELRAFAEEMGHRHGPPGDGPPREGGPDGPGRRGDEPGRPPRPPEGGGDRPQRPPAE